VLGTLSLSAAYVSANIDTLNADPWIATIDLTDGGTPALTLTVNQALNDTLAYQSKIKAQSDLLQQAQAAKNPNNAVMGEQTLTLRKAWAVYDSWLADPRVVFHPEPRQAEAAFRLATEPIAAKPASKWVGDCWLLAFAQATHSRLITFDQALVDFAKKQGHAAVRPA